MNITFDQLIDCLKQSTETISFKVDATDYYDKPGDLSNAYMDVINPNTLIELLQDMQGVLDK